eukprot:1158445-Pelagomonas_calceolata.AAC.2
MDLTWKHQIQQMTCNLRGKLDNLDSSYASRLQTLDIVRAAIVPSLAYAFAVTPCTPADLSNWGTMIDRITKHKYEIWNSTAAAMIREDFDNFGSHLNLCRIPQTPGFCFHIQPKGSLN